MCSGVIWIIKSHCRLSNNFLTLYTGSVGVGSDGSAWRINNFFRWIFPLLILQVLCELFFDTPLRSLGQMCVPIVSGSIKHTLSDLESTSAWRINFHYSAEVTQSVGCLILTPLLPIMLCRRNA